MPTMFVLVNLKEDVTPAAYERWLEESYVPAVLWLASVDDWRGHRVVGPGQKASEPPYRYVVAVEINDLERLGEDMEKRAGASPSRGAGPLRGGNAAHDGALRLNGGL